MNAHAVEENIEPISGESYMVSTTWAKINVITGVSSEGYAGKGYVQSD